MTPEPIPESVTVVLGACRRRNESWPRFSFDGMARAKAVESGRTPTRWCSSRTKEAGGYTVTCPALPGLVTEGNTLEQARERAGGIRCYLESLRKDGLASPD